MWSRKAGTPLTTLHDLSIADVCTEIANLQWAIIVERAQGAYARPPKERTGAIETLRQSTNDLDRYAAALVRAWLKAPHND